MAIKSDIGKAGKPGAPVGVKIISILYYILSAFLVIFGLLMLFGASAITSLFSQPGITAGFSSLSWITSGLLIVAGIIFIALAVLGVFIGIGLWKLKKWARIVAIIFAVLGFVFALIAMFSSGILSNILSLILNGVIGWYLWFNKNVKKAFA